MSGITPLIDTLMHQVLGRQGEASLQRSINAPVQPVTPGDGPRALSRDAGLDGRPTTLPLDDLRRLPPSPQQGGRGLAPPAGDTPPGSTQTHLSPAARGIADVLLRFPSPPTALRLDAPLMGLNDTPTATTLANRLDASIRDSGLFYEAHLKRWFQGDVPRLQLMREPQMQLARPFTAAQAPAMGAPSAAWAPPATSGTGFPMAGVAHASLPSTVTILPNTALVLQAPPTGAALLKTPPGPMPGVAVEPSGPGLASSSERGVVDRPTGRVATTPAPLIEEKERSLAPRDAAGIREYEALAPTKREVVHESLQGLVRQQLEMLVAPAIRWEGDVWAGIFMALVINLPGARQSGQEGGEGEEAEQEWRSEMDLEVPAIGAFHIALSLFRSTLGVEMSTGDNATYQRLESSLGVLETRLGALDFQKVRVHLKELAGEA
ncbi:flagellar hook-length control protein FliK [Vreelandella sp. EE22]